MSLVQCHSVNREGGIVWTQPTLLMPGWEGWSPRSIFYLSNYTFNFICVRKYIYNQPFKPNISWVLKISIHFEARKIWEMEQPQPLNTATVRGCPWHVTQEEIPWFFLSLHPPIGQLPNLGLSYRVGPERQGRTGTTRDGYLHQPRGRTSRGALPSQ